MISLKDAIDRDIHAVFLNDAEFAETHIIDDALVSCVIEKDVVQGASGSFEGVFLNTMTINVSMDALGRVPVEGELINIDGAFYLVRNVSIEMGMFVIVCEANEQ